MLAAADLVAAATEQTGLEDFGGDEFRLGLEILTGSLATEADLTDLGVEILGLRLRMLLTNRLHIEDAYRQHPAIADQVVEGPLVIIGLPRTGTTALSQLVSADPQIRSLRLWESSNPVPPPESATQDTDPRIEDTAQGLEAMYTAFPKMKSMYFQTATGATECQDLLGMTFRTAHFDGMAHVPRYTDWVENCDMAPAYRYHRRVLQLLQWRCPPRLWHLKTPVHMLALGQLLDAYPDAKFLWTHRDPAAVLGSVCSLIAYTRSWVSDRVDADLGQRQIELWAEALRRAMAFRRDAGEERFADIRFGDLNADPVGTVERAYDRLGLTLGGEGSRRMAAWAAEHPPGAHGVHAYSLEEFDVDRNDVRERFSFYLEHFDIGDDTTTD
jgi:sulfotransferase family protein